MIVKTSRYSNEKGVGIQKPIGKHIGYIFRDYGKNPEVDTLVYYHNIRTKDCSPKGIVRAFEANEKYRHQKNAYNKQHGYKLNVLHSYDEIISVAAIDRDKILDNLWIMQDFGKELMQKIAPDGLGVVVIHIDKDHIHAHCYRHSFKYRKLENTKTNNEQFMDVRKHLEKVQQERYPQLETKLVYSGLEQGMKQKKQGRSKGIKNGLGYQERTGKILKKDLMKEALQDFHRIAQDEAHFFELIGSHNIDLYYRGDTEIGKHKHTTEGRQYAGVWVNKKRIRFATLGVSKAQLRALSERVITPKIEKQEKEVFPKEEQTKKQSVLSKYAQYRKTKKQDKDRGLER